MDHYTVDELREEAEAYLEYRRDGHPKATVTTDQSKIKLFLDWLEEKSSSTRRA